MLIKCGGCEAIHESTLAACPGCGRCPACGARRVSVQQLAEQAQCSDCDVLFCIHCGRCAGCGKLRIFDLGVCACGHPDDPDQVASVERSFGLS